MTEKLTAEALELVAALEAKHERESVKSPWSCRDRGLLAWHAMQAGSHSGCCVKVDKDELAALQSAYEKAGGWVLDGVFYPADAWPRVAARALHDLYMQGEITL